MQQSLLLLGKWWGVPGWGEVAEEGGSAKEHLSARLRQRVQLGSCSSHYPLLLESAVQFKVGDGGLCFVQVAQVATGKT